jgi:hypothetical protein
MEELFTERTVVSSHGPFGQVKRAGAAGTCPGLTWEVLAGIGTMESDNGRSRAGCPSWSCSRSPSSGWAIVMLHGVRIA